MRSAVESGRADEPDPLEHPPQARWDLGRFRRWTPCDEPVWRHPPRGGGVGFGVAARH